MKSNQLHAPRKRRPDRRFWFAFIALAVGRLMAEAPAHAANLVETDPSAAATGLTRIQFPRLRYSLSREDNWTAESEAALGSGRDSDRRRLKSAAASAPAPPMRPHRKRTRSPSARPIGQQTCGWPVRCIWLGSSRPAVRQVPQPTSILLIGLASLALYLVGRHWSRQSAASAVALSSAVLSPAILSPAVEPTALRSVALRQP